MRRRTEAETVRRKSAEHGISSPKNRQKIYLLRDGTRIAASTRDKAPSQLHANEIPRGDLYTCRPEDDAKTALTLMRDRRVRRVPVTAPDGTLVGIVSLNDLVLAADEQAEIRASDVVDAFKGVCAHRPLATPAATATAAKTATAGATA